MNTRPSLYRSTLIAAALAIGSLGAASAEAHEHGWRGHEAPPRWHERGWHEHGWRGDGRPGYFEPGWRGWEAPFAVLPPPLPYAAPGVAVVVRLPL
jgi:hypothetical protein